MAPKQQLDKKAWEWAENTTPDKVTQQHVETAYRVTFPRCKQCRKNCAGNPHCLTGLGERKWMKEIEDKYWHDVEDPNLERREKGSYVGLKNLGATCYVNTFLQVWFHNHEFRQIIYKWIEPQQEAKEADDKTANGTSTEHQNDSTEKKKGEGSEVVASSDEKTVSTVGKTGETSSVDARLTPSTVVGHLQLIFALLQFSNRRYIDPSDFLKFLGLDMGQQQDAQEFSKLFVSLLDDTLQQQPREGMNNLLQGQFGGQYSYVTKCSKCSIESHRPSDFFELDLNIKGHKTLENCINEFLEEEKLDGDNKYHCTTCASKEDAVRRIQLNKLPKVLNLQLLRFVFDRKTGHKKKLNTFIQFPETLDMGQFVNKPEGEVVYELTAVLIHRGPSAYSGHYIAHIKQHKSQNWYKFNDEEIEKVAGKNLQLGNEEEMEGKGSKKPRTPKGCHSSRNAYMLVYQRREEQPQTDASAVTEVSLSTLPSNVQQYVCQDNENFESWINEMLEMREKNVNSGKARQEEVKEVYKMLQTKEGDGYELIVCDWLIKWLEANSAQAVPEVNNSKLLCQHQKVDPEKISKFKCIRQEAAEILYSKYSGGPRLKSDSLCWKCVKERCHVIRTRARLAVDHKYISELLKNKNLDIDLSDSFWIGKQSLRSWKRLVMEELEELDPPAQMNGRGEDHKEGVSEKDEEGNDDQKEEKPDAKDTKPEQEKVKKAPEKVKEEEHLNFNEDVLCIEHKQLDPDDSCRRLVPGEVWRRLREYFPACPQYSATADVCSECKRLNDEEMNQLEMKKQTATRHRAALGNLFNDRNRPIWSKKVTQLNIVPKHFLDQWRNFIKDPIKQDLVCDIGTRLLLCDHAKLPYYPDMVGISMTTEGLVYIYPSEWKELSDLIPGSPEIQVNRIEEESGMVTFVASPDVCEPCSQAGVKAEREKMLDYKSAAIYVRKLTPDQLAPGVSASQGSGESAEASPAAKQKDGEDQEFVLQKNGKRKKSVDGSLCPEKMAKSDPSGDVRRSSRHRRLRGEKEVTVSSTQTLWDLKILLMKQFSAAPMDQHLYLGTTELRGDKTTLSELDIIPQSILYLKVDEPCDDPIFIDDMTKAGSVEEGFKGTNLLGR